MGSLSPCSLYSLNRCPFPPVTLFSDEENRELIPPQWACIPEMFSSYSPFPPHLFLLGLAFESTLARLSSLLGERVRLNVRFFPFLKWKKTVKRQRTPVTTNQACLSARVPPPSGLNLYFFPVFLLIPLSVLDANSVLFLMVFL